MSGLRDLFAVPPLPEQEETREEYLLKKLDRRNELLNRELKKGVELGRKLGAFESRFGKLRTHITGVVSNCVLKVGLDPNDKAVLEFRNAVRIMKGKNKL